ncbi:uncharacterized protein LOC133845721 [Drosophila sulfurigaster albostrigata]|uniref:uncharacterized protein LOC133845721 n=1 Tax=Drosophila sulfurigaster albostrigata TaxID=89887 RepID=UPI002D2186E0|nr:uncharacterized protein LOC133845721 [Drosophila sulfurigaster albostrigata]
MKIIFFGLLIAVLVVYGHGYNNNEPANVPSKIPSTDLYLSCHESLKRKLEVSIDENKIKIEKIEKELEEGAKQISFLRANMPNSTLRSDFQKLLDILVQGSENKEKFVAFLKQSNEEYKTSIIAMCN